MSSIQESISTITNEIKSLLKDIACVTDRTQKTASQQSKIEYAENPLNPNLLAYCFDAILGFDVRYRVFEKVNYVIEFVYKGTYACACHQKMSYTVTIDEAYKEELIALFKKIHPLLEKLFLLIGESALTENNFSMENEAPTYFMKMEFYQERIEKLEQRKHIIEEKCHGQYEVVESTGKYTVMRMKGADYLKSLNREIVYDIEAYVDTFFSALEHILTLLCPFNGGVEEKKSYYKNYIRNTKWHWEAKIRDACNGAMPDEVVNELKRIKEVYRNHNAHGGFSREMMAYIQIPLFGRYPMYVGKEYLQGFMEGASDTVSYDMYLHSKEIFCHFWDILDEEFPIPMMFVRSGLPIPVDTSSYTRGIDTVEQAEWKIERLWFDIDNQSNMDW